MKITVLHGSPKGETSATRQYVRFLEEVFPEHEWRVHNVAQQIHLLARDEERWARLLDEVGGADVVLWSTPVYFMLVPGGLKRFIELVDERGERRRFSGKYTLGLTTSIRFFDHTAHNYLRAVAEDWGMKWLGSYSADMFDLMHGVERERLHAFGEGALSAATAAAPTARAFAPLAASDFVYEPGANANPVALPGKRVLVVTDARPRQVNITRMVETLTACFSPAPRVVNLHDLRIKGECTGCLRCSYANECLYRDRDDYVAFYEGEVKRADVLVFAGAMRDRYLSARWKTFFDRSFYNNHVPSIAGKQLAYLVAGPLSQEPNLRQILTAYAEAQRANLAGIITDEVDDSAALDALLARLAEELARCARTGYVHPESFLGTAGHKIFRDEVFSRLRFPFRADHHFYKTSGAYDFPQHEYKHRLVNGLLLALTRLPGPRRELYQRRLKREIIRPLEQALERARARRGELRSPARGEETARPPLG